MRSRPGKLFVLLTLGLVVVPIVLAGCGTATDAGEETSGKPAVIFFWEPG